MKVVVCGSRNLRSPARVWRELDRLHAEYKFTDLMHGGAKGVDRHAKEWAKTKPEIQVWVCPALWKKFGPAAGPIRNGRMLQWKPDLVIAFPGGPGTANMMELAKRAGVPVHRVQPTPVNGGQDDAIGAV
jgi:predicted Rossmann-fold nucleotide-binding protein